METSTNEIGTRLVVSVPDQTLSLWRDGAQVGSYPVSTSKFGEGSESGSFRTPLGKLRVAEKIGAGAPVGAVYEGRIPTGAIADQGGATDRVLTRILWLEGMEPANANTRERYIYIHGTNQEDRIGTKASHGCVRMRNADIVDLFDRVPVGTVVEIIA